MQTSASGGAAHASLADPMPGTRIAGWEVIRLLGRGGMATVYEARWPESGVRRAIKLMNPSGSPDEVERRFRREFRALSKLHHPNITAVYDWGWWTGVDSGSGPPSLDPGDSQPPADYAAGLGAPLAGRRGLDQADAPRPEGRPYFVMELVDGEDLRAAVETWQELPAAERFQRARDVLVQVARALEYVHLRGLVHRDVTPANIMLIGDAPSGGSAADVDSAAGRGPCAVKLMDFGVVKESGVTEFTAHGEVLGTVAYIAPEQINGGKIDARTDLYSLGAVLYLMLTGRRPFNARTLAGYLDKHLHRPPRPPREIAPSVPPELEDICMRLLQKEPGERFSSATHLLHVLEGADANTLRVDDGSWPPVLVSRTEESAILAQTVAALLEGKAAGGKCGSLVIVEGAHGLGKSRMGRLARDLTRSAGVASLRIRASGAGGPLAAFRSLVDTLKGETVSVPRALQQLYGLEGDDKLERYGVYAAFREMLTNSPPRLILIEDAHEADDVGVELIEYLVRNTLALANEPLIWLLTRTPGTSDARFEALLSGSSTGVVPVMIPVRPLTSAAVEELVLALLPDDGPSRLLARRLHKEGEGNPAFITEMMRGLVEQGTIKPEDGHARLVVDEAQLLRLALPIPRSVREGLVTRIQALSANAREIAQVLAVGNQEMTIPLLSAASLLDEQEILSAADELIDAGLIRERRVEGEEHIDLAQARVRDLLQAEVAPRARTRYHRLIGEALERTYRRRANLVVEALAWHFEQGEVPGKAYSYLLRSGQRLLGRSFVAEALVYLDRALAIEPDAREYITLEDADRLLAETMLLRAEALEHLGRWAEVSKALEQSLEVGREIGDERLLSRIHTARGRLSRHDADLELSESEYREAVRLAERVSDPTLRVMPLHGLGVVSWYRGELEAARHYWVEALAVAESVRDERSLGWAYNGLGLVALGKGQAGEARRHFEQSAEIFERVGMLSGLSTARVNLVEIHHFTGNLRRGLELAEKTCQLAREIHHPLGMARGRHHKSVLLVDLARYDEALVEANGALEIARALDHKDEEVVIQVAMIRAGWALGDLGLVRGCLSSLEPLLPRHDTEGFAPIVLSWSARLAAHEGDRESARRLLQAALDHPGTRWSYQECRLDLSLAHVYAELGDRAEATRRGESAIRRADAAGFRYYSLKGHCIAAGHSADEAAVARHRRVADALARSLAANLSREDGERFLDAEWLKAIRG
ncbi:MAG: tetratricopeptide repeat protein [Myxococcales bacterium]|nr:tetratricopeptide repeat protein [Myxococcales bacterium]